ncbi:MAG: alpha/beta fold hydrolase [Ilumatobacteraceae bacterium]
MTHHIACNDATVIDSLDGVKIVMHDFGGDGTPVLLSHATGFHAHCWEPVAARLSSRHHVFGLDHRGYGDAETVDPATISWRQYGDDALAAARHVSNACGGKPVVGVGHSMGGASLLMAAHRERSLFSALFVFEPIVFPPPDPVAGPRPESPLPAGARKRRATFPSYETAIENFAAKPPLASFHPRAREAYVRHGFRPTADGIELKCLPEHEARTYETGGTSGAWDDLPTVSVPTWVLSGTPAPFQPSSFAVSVAERIPGATYVQYDEMGHFGPLEHPDTISEMVERTLATLA